jgi:hypothetical protein
MRRPDGVRVASWLVLRTLHRFSWLGGKSIAASGLRGCSAQCGAGILALLIVDYPFRLDPVVERLVALAGGERCFDDVISQRKRFDRR